MKIKRFDFWAIIFYPFILNPFFLLFFAAVILNFLFVSWWAPTGFKKDHDYWHLRFNPENFADRFEDVFLALIIMLTNSVWFYTRRSQAYAKYVKQKWFPHPIPSSQQYYLNEKYRYYLNVKNRVWDKQGRKIK